MAILKCCDFRLHHWNTRKQCHDFGQPNVSSPRFHVAPSFPSETCIDVIQSSPSLRPSSRVNSWKAAGLGNAKWRGIPWYHRITRQISSVLLTFEANLNVTDTRRKKNLIRCKPNSTIDALNGDSYECFQCKYCIVGMESSLRC